MPHRSAEQRRVMREADEATALPRYWPAWVVVVVALTAFVSIVFPMGFAPSI